MADKLDLLLTLTTVAEGLDRIEALEKQFEELRKFVDMPLTTSINFQARNVEVIRGVIQDMAKSGEMTQAQAERALAAVAVSIERAGRSMGYAKQVGEGVSAVYTNAMSTMGYLMDQLGSSSDDAAAKLKEVTTRLENLQNQAATSRQRSGQFDEIVQAGQALRDQFGEDPLGKIQLDENAFIRYGVLLRDLRDAVEAVGGDPESVDALGMISDPSSRDDKLAKQLNWASRKRNEELDAAKKLEEQILVAKREQAELQKQVSEETARLAQANTADTETQTAIIKELTEEISTLKQTIKELQEAPTDQPTTRRRPKGQVATDGGVEAIASEVAQAIPEQITQNVLVVPKLEGDLQIPVDREYIIDQIRQAVEAANELKLKVGVTLEGVAPTAPEKSDEQLIKESQEVLTRGTSLQQGIEAAKTLLNEFAGLSHAKIVKLDPQKLAQFMRLIETVQESAWHLGADTIDALKLDKLAHTKRARGEHDEVMVATPARYRDQRLQRFLEAAEKASEVQAADVESQSATAQELNKVLTELADPSRWEALKTVLGEAFNTTPVIAYRDTIKELANVQSEFYEALDKSPQHFSTLDAAIEAPLGRLRSLENMLTGITEHANAISSRTQATSENTANAFAQAAQNIQLPQTRLGAPTRQFSKYADAIQKAADALNNYQTVASTTPDLFYNLETPVTTLTEKIQEMRTATRELTESVRHLRNGIKSLGEFSQDAAGPISEFTAAIHMAIGQMDTPGGEKLRQIADQTAQTRALEEHTEQLKRQAATTAEVRAESERLQRELKTLQERYDKLTETEKRKKTKENEGKPAPSLLDNIRHRFRTLGVFAPVATVVFGVTMAVRRSIQEALELESIFAEIQGVLPSKNISDRYRIEDAVIKSAREYGVAVKESAEAAKFFAQAGYVSPRAIGDATRVAMLGVKGAGLTPQEAQELILALRAITQGAIEAEDVLDRISRVEARRAVSSQDLFQVITRVGPIAEQLKGDAVGILDGFDLIMGATTGIIERTRITGSQAATSLRFIIARLGSPEIVRNLQSLGDVRLAADEAGQTLRPLREILQDLAIAYERLRSAGRTNVANQLLVQLGGARQLSATTALLQSFLRDGLDTAREGALAFGDLGQRAEISLNTIRTAMTRTQTGLTTFGNALIEFPGIHATIVDFFNTLGQVTGGAGDALNYYGREIRNFYSNPFEIKFLTDDEIANAPRVRQFEKTAHELRMRAEEVLNAVRAPAVELADLIAERYQVVIEKGEEVVKAIDIQEGLEEGAKKANLQQILRAFDLGQVVAPGLREEVGTLLADELAKTIPLFAEYQQKLAETTKEDEKAAIEKERLSKAFALLGDAAYLTNAIFGGNVERVRAQVESINAEIDTLFDKNQQMRRTFIATDTRNTPVEYQLRMLERQADVFVQSAGRLAPAFDKLLRGSNTFELYQKSLQNVVSLDPSLRSFGNVLGDMAKHLEDLEGPARDAVLGEVGRELFKIMGFDRIPEGQFLLGLDPQESYRNVLKDFFKDAIEYQIRSLNLTDEHAQKLRALAEILGSSGASEAFKLQEQRDVFSKATDPFAQLVREFVKGERATAAFTNQLARVGVTFDPLQAKLDNTVNFFRGLLTFIADTEDHLVNLNTQIKNLSTIKVDGKELGIGPYATNALEQARTGFEKYVQNQKGSIDDLTDSISLYQDATRKIDPIKSLDEELTLSLLERDTKRADAKARLEDERDTYLKSLQGLVGERGQKLTDIFGINEESIRLITDFQQALNLIDEDPAHMRVFLADLQRAAAARVESLQREASAIRERDNILSHTEQVERMLVENARQRASLTATPEDELIRQHDLEMTLLDIREQRAENERHKNKFAYEEELNQINRARAFERERLRLGLETQRYLRGQRAGIERINILLDSQVAQARLYTDLQIQQNAYRERIADRLEQERALQDALYRIEQQRILNDPRLQGDANSMERETALLRLSTEHQNTQLARERLAIVEAENKLAEQMRQNVEQSLSGFKTLITDAASFRKATGAERFAQLLGPLSQNLLNNTVDELFREAFDPKSSGILGRITRSLGGFTADRAKRDLMDTAQKAGVLQGESAGQKMLTMAPEIGRAIANQFMTGAPIQGNGFTFGTGTITGPGVSTKAAPTANNPLGLPEHLLQPRTSTRQAEKETQHRLRTLTDQISLLATTMGTTFGLRGGAGTQTGASLGGAFGQSLGKDAAESLFKDAGAGIGSAIGTAALPVIGTAVGGVLGGLIGGLFDDDSPGQVAAQSLQRIDQNTRQAATILEIQRQLMETARGAVNVPATFSVPQYTPQAGTVIEKVEFSPQIVVQGNVDADELAETMYSRLGSFLHNEFGAMGIRIP